MEHYFFVIKINVDYYTSLFGELIYLNIDSVIMTHCNNYNERGKNKNDYIDGIKTVLSP